MSRHTILKVVTLAIVTAIVGCAATTPKPKGKEGETVSELSRDNLSAADPWKVVEHCERGLAIACTEAGARLEKQGAPSEDIAELARQGCLKGDPNGCELAFRHIDDVDVALFLAQEACTAGIPSACDHADELVGQLDDF